ncbi:MAG: NAD-dependent epimerase/dehydratase family protein [Gammaproteobacteria bacterium]
MKRVLLTGATGFIGRHASSFLVARGYEVHAISSRQCAEAIAGIHWHQANLLDDAETSRLLTEVRPTHLLHFAWYAEPGKFWHSTDNFRWLEASIALLRRFGEQGGKRVVIAGTCAEYDWDYGFCSETITPCRPATNYGVCKNALFETMRAFCSTAGMSSAWGRIFFLFGPHEHPARLVASVITELLRGDTARCTHGYQVRDFLHVVDVASAFVALLDGTVEGAVNIASGQPVAVREIVLAAAECLGARDRVEFGALHPSKNEPPVLLADVRRLTEEVGWRPVYDLARGIAQTVCSWSASERAPAPTGKCPSKA